MGLITYPNPGKLDTSVRYVVTGTGPTAGTVLDAVGVLPAEDVHFWRVIVDKRGLNSNVGIAVVNPYDQALDVFFNFSKGPNAVPGTATVKFTLPPRGHLAKFVSELFPVPFSDIATLTINSSSNFNVVARRQDGTQLSALPAHKAVHFWNWVVPATGTGANGHWTYTFFDQGSFFGIEDYTGSQAFSSLRGSFIGNRFIAERGFTESDGTKGLVVYQGTRSVEGGVLVITGTITNVTDKGTILGTSTFKAF